MGRRERHDLLEEEPWTMVDQASRVPVIKHGSLSDVSCKARNRHDLHNIISENSGPPLTHLDLPRAAIVTLVEGFRSPRCRNRRYAG